MEQEIKNFDRAIERIMDQQQVTPPFSMWNRISAELESTPAAAPAQPNSMMPRRAMYGLLAAAIIGASLVGAYMLGSSPKNEVATSSKTAAPVIAQMAPVTQPTINQSVAAIEAPIAPQHKAISTSRHTIIRNQQQAITVAAETKPATASVTAVEANQQTEKAAAVGFTVISNNDVPVPSSESINKSGDINGTYYFPPVDNITPSKASTQIASTASKEESATKAGEEKRIDEPAKPVKFHPHKHKGFGYGKINRFK